MTLRFNTIFSDSCVAAGGLDSSQGINIQETVKNELLKLNL